MIKSRSLTLLRRALALRCIACGKRPVLLSWFREASSCPACGFRLDRSEAGYWIGSYTVNMCVTLLAITLIIVGMIWAAWPAVNWTLVTVVGVVSSIALPFLIFPWTKTLYLALDVLFRPPEEAEFSVPLEPGLGRDQRGGAPRNSR